MCRIRLGLVGGGGSSFIGAVHRAAATLSGRYDLVAAALSSDPERARDFAAHLGIPPERSYEDFVRMAAVERTRPDGIDAVAILTPNGHHVSVAKAFAGFHIICEKPVTTSLADARELIALTRGSGRVFAVAHAYTGYTMVHEARSIVRSGALGPLRLLQVEYAQSWLATALEQTGDVIAQRRTDPSVNGAAGCVAAIGTHAFNMAEFVTGLALHEVAADLTSFVPGRAVPDNAHMLLRYGGGARGIMWVSQVAPGHDNDLRLRVYGERGSVFWSQGDPDNLMLNIRGEPRRIVTRGGAGSNAPKHDPVAMPAGHPEGFVGAFANFYRATAEQIKAAAGNRACSPQCVWVPDLAAGARAVAFSEAALQSSTRNGEWTHVCEVSGQP